MCLLLESIGVEEGEAKLLIYHQQRMNRSRRELFGITQEIDLTAIVSPLINEYPIGLYKCRILYREAIEQIEFVPYQRPQIKSLKKVYSQDMDYSHKYVAREALTALFQQRGDCDDVLIIKNGVVTDSYFANILFAKEGQWYTSDQPLLKGVQRQFLIEKENVQERQILEGDLTWFQYYKFINALNPFNTSPSIPIRNIY